MDLGTEVDVAAHVVLQGRQRPVWEAFVVLDGVVRTDDGSGEHVHGPGAVLGWPEIHTGDPSPTTVTTASPARLLVLSRREAAAWINLRRERSTA